HKEVLQAGALAVLSEAVRLAEDLGYALDHGHHLVPAHEGVQAHRKMRFRREPAAHAQGESNLGMPVKRPRESGQSNVVDLRIRAPDAAAGDRDLELARQVVEVTVADEQPGGL